MLSVWGGVSGGGYGVTKGPGIRENHCLCGVSYVADLNIFDPDSIVLPCRYWKIMGSLKMSLTVSESDGPIKVGEEDEFGRCLHRREI